MPEINDRPPPLGGGTPNTSRLQHYLKLARHLIDSLRVAKPDASTGSKQPKMAQKIANVPQIRDELVDTLTHAIEETNKIAKQAGVTAERGEGGMPGKARWYQLLGYLAQVLDGVCRNVELSEINERLVKVESELDIAPSRPTQKA